MKLKPETVGFVRGGMLFLEPAKDWRKWQRDIWTCCGTNPEYWMCRACHATFRYHGKPNFCARCRGRDLVLTARANSFPEGGDHNPERPQVGRARS